MSDKTGRYVKTDHQPPIPQVYQIRVEGILDPQWSNWFECMDVSVSGDDTLIMGPVADQSALHGQLRKIRDLNLVLLSLERQNKKPSERSSEDGDE